MRISLNAKSKERGAPARHSVYFSGSLYFRSLQDPPLQYRPLVIRHAGLIALGHGVGAHGAS
jgi:hypothetical protein